GQQEPFDDRAWAGLALTCLRVPGLSTDSRQLKAGQLFVALKGPQFDAHRFLEHVQADGACAAVVSQPQEALNLTQYHVDDTLQAFHKLVIGSHLRFSLPVVSVCCSNGTTSTKEILAMIFTQVFSYDTHLVAQCNFNSETVLPLTL